MTAADESPAGEVSCSKRSFLGPQTTIRLGAWNVRTMYETSKTAQVIREMQKYKLDVLGVSECRWTGSGRKVTKDGSTILFSGREDAHSSGVALLISKKTTKSLIEWEPISDRLLRVRFDSRYCKMTILQCYAPTNEAEEESKDDWYEQLQSAVSNVPQHDLLLIMGDLNAKVGRDNTGREDVMGRHGCGTINDNGERLVDFCTNNRCKIGGTIFPHKDIHKLSWRSPDGHTTNQIDHIIINKKWQRSLLDVKVHRGADVGSDHHLVIAKIRLKLRAVPTTKHQRKVFDINKLLEPKIQKEFTIELRNRFSALQNENEGTDQGNVEETWGNITKLYKETAERVLGFRKKGNKEWITSQTWTKIDERRKAKDKLMSAKSPRLTEQAKREYRTKDLEVKRSARRDKRAFVENLASIAEAAAAKGKLSTVYRITKQLSGRKSINTKLVKDKQGNLITTEKEQAERWVQHFEEVLNGPEPEEPADPIPIDDLGINTDPPSQAEVEEAIRVTKKGKAPGIDMLHAEMMTADTITASRVLTDLFSKIWEQNAIPKDWSKGLICRLPKKGDRKNCDNWRGITLLSIPSKIFCRILVERLDSAIDGKLREEQGGFRKGRGCIDQIFTLRNIIEQCIEWNTPLYINFIDFKKAFDSVHRESLWKILRAYGIPAKIVNIIKMFYEHFECRVILDNTLTEPFPVKSGVRQGCVLSPILFLITIDWVMRQTTAGRPRGIQWTPFSFLEDLDFADDLAIMSPTHSHLQEKTNLLNNHAKQTGLYINQMKTQVMCINTAATRPITIDGEALKRVEEFPYLGSIISSESGTQKDIKTRLTKARGAFSQLHNIWKSKQYSLRTKVRLYNSNVKAVLLYGSECWRATKQDMQKIDVFHNNCLRKICNIFWPNKISNEELYKRTGSSHMSLEIQKRRLRWLGHVFRMPNERTPKVALRWTPVGKRKRGRPKNTWRRTVMTELKGMGLSWDGAQAKARDRVQWQCMIAALCPSRDEEDK